MRRRGYDGASRGRRGGRWIATNQSANGELEGSLEWLRARARDLARNNPYAAKALDVIVANTVGRGIKAQASGSSEAAHSSAEELWQRWAGSRECDAAGRCDMNGLQRLVMRTFAESGECLIRRRFRRPSDGLSVPLQLQVLEPDHLDTSKDTVGDVGGNRVVQGVEFDALGRRVAYHLFRSHPGEPSSLTDTQSTRVPASEILHVYEESRPGQVRGVPMGASCFMRLRDIDEFEEARLLREKVSNAYAGFITTPSLDEDPGVSGGGDDEEEWDEEHIEPATVRKLGPGEDYRHSTPPSVQGFDEYMRASLRAIACGYCVTFEQLTGDLSGVNFSSGRMGWLEHERKVGVWRWGLLIPQFCDPVWSWFVDTAQATGVGIGEGVRAQWTPPRREMIQPKEDVAAMKDAVRCGFMSPQQVQRQLGNDPQELMAETAAFWAMVDELGVVLDIDPRRGVAGSGGAVAPQGPPDGESETEDEDAEKAERISRNGALRTTPAGPWPPRA